MTFLSDAGEAVLYSIKREPSCEQAFLQPTLPHLWLGGVQPMLVLCEMMQSLLANEGGE